MKAMTLLRAMSEIEPCDIEAAMRAGAGGVRAGTDDSADDPPPAALQMTALLPAAAFTGAAASEADESDAPHSLIRWHYAGLAAAAACFALTAGALLCFRGQDHGFVASPSHPERITEIAPAATTTASTALSGTSVTAADTEQQVDHTTADRSAQTTATTNGTASEAPAAVPGEETAAQEETQTDPVTQTSAQETSHTTTAAPVIYAARVPALLATGDAAGELADRAELSVIRDAAAIRAYLEGDVPEIAVGSGHKSAAEVSAIEDSPVLLRIRWRADAPRGLQSVSLDADGVLHVAAAGYCPYPDESSPQPWVYETSLLIEAGTLPEIRTLDFSLEEHIESDGGILEWVRFTEGISEDLYIENNAS